MQIPSRPNHISGLNFFIWECSTIFWQQQKRDLRATKRKASSRKKNSNLYFMRAQKMVHEKTYECWKVDDWAPERSLRMLKPVFKILLSLENKETQPEINFHIFAFCFTLIRMKRKKNTLGFLENCELPRRLLLHRVGNGVWDLKLEVFWGFKFEY